MNKRINISVLFFASALGFACSANAQIASSDTTSGSIYGTVLDAATKKPLPGLTITLYIRDEVGPVTEPPITTTSTDGSYRFSNIAPSPDSLDNYRMTICDTGYICSNTNVHGLLPGQEKRLDLPMSKPFLFTVQTALKGSPANFLKDVHIATITPKRDQDLPQWWGRTNIALSDSAGKARFGSSSQGQTWGATLGTTFQVSVSKEGFRTQIISKTLSVDSWQDSLSVALEPESPVTSQTLSGSVTDPSGSADGLAVMFLGSNDGKPFAEFDYVKGGQFKIGGIPDTISEGALFVVGDSLHIVKADFSRSLSLNSKRPLTTGLRISRSERNEKGSIGPSKTAYGISGKRRVNLLGQDFHGIAHESKGAVQAQARGILSIAD